MKVLVALQESSLYSNLVRSCLTTSNVQYIAFQVFFGYMKCYGLIRGALTFVYRQCQSFHQGQLHSRYFMMLRIAQLNSNFVMTIGVYLHISSVCSPSGFSLFLICCLVIDPTSGSSNLIQTLLATFLPPTVCPLFICMAPMAPLNMPMMLNLIAKKIKKYNTKQ